METANCTEFPLIHVQIHCNANENIMAVTVKAFFNYVQFENAS